MFDKQSCYLSNQRFLTVKAFSCLEPPSTSCRTSIGYVQVTDFTTAAFHLYSMGVDGTMHPKDVRTAGEMMAMMEVMGYAQ